VHSVTDRQTDRQTDGQQAARTSQSYCVAVRSAKKEKLFRAGLYSTCEGGVEIENLRRF